MNCEVEENKILVLQDELDIYDAPALKEKISTVAAANNNSVVVDLQKVEYLTTPIIQVFIAARKGSGGLKILNMNEAVMRDFKLFGFSL